MKTLGRHLSDIRRVIWLIEPGPERDAMFARFESVVDMIKEVPARVALQAPFADRDEAALVLETELRRALDGWEMP